MNFFKRLGHELSKIDLSHVRGDVLLTHAATYCATAAGLGTLGGQIPGKIGTVITTVAAVGAALGPRLTEAAGVFKAVQGGQATVAAQVGQAFQNAADAPKQQAAQDLQALVEALVEKKLNQTNMNGFSAEELGKAAPVDKSHDDHAVASMESEGGVAPVVAAAKVTP